VGVLIVLCVQESVARLVKGMNLWMLALMGSLLLFLMTMIDTLVYRVRHTHAHAHTCTHDTPCRHQASQLSACPVVLWCGGWGGQDLGLWGLAWGALVLNGIFFPAASFYMLWALSKTAKALKGEQQAHTAAKRGLISCAWPQKRALTACPHGGVDVLTCVGVLMLCVQRVRGRTASSPVATCTRGASWC
jgi:hypothetical protein